ncbi:MAG: HupE/UreJ family protein [Acidimicrobiia bacterium]
MSRRSLVVRTRVVLVLSVLMVLSSVGIAGAHNANQSYVYLDIYESSVEGRIEYPTQDLNEVLGLAIPTDPDFALAGAEANEAAIHSYSDEHFGMFEVSGEEWGIEFGELEILEVGNGSYIVVNFAVVREFVDVPRTFTVSYDGIIHQIPNRDALLVIGTDWGSGTFNNEASELLRFTPETSVQTVDLGNTSFWTGFAGVVALGTEHIRIGTDHILFILALVLPAVLVFREVGGWQPSSSFGSSLWRVLKIVTMFTIAHSITLTLGGLGIVEFPPAMVETVIAVSIILAALHNIKPVFMNKEWIIAFGFGLFHGFGFAGLLSDLGLTQSRQFVSLLGFNLGIEIGQAVIIIAIFPALFLARRTRVYLPAMYFGSVVLMAIAAAWALDRAVGVDLGVDQIVDRVVLWPRSLVFIALMYVAAAGLYWFDRSRDALVPMVSEDAPATEDLVSVPGA